MVHVAGPQTGYATGMLRKAFLQEVFLALSQGRCQTLAGCSRDALPILESWMECTSLGPHLDLMPLESRAHYARRRPQDSLRLYPPQAEGFGVELQDSIMARDVSLCIHGPSSWPQEPLP